VSFLSLWKYTAKLEPGTPIAVADGDQIPFRIDERHEPGG
jgi:hypothetical protein